MVWNKLEVQEQILRQTLQKELQDSDRGVYFQIESPVDKLEVARAALVQDLHRCQEFLQIKGPGGLVERTQTKLALERAAARCLYVKQSVRQIGVAVLSVGQRNLVQGRLLTLDHFQPRLGFIQQGAAEFWKAHITPASDDMIRQTHDVLVVKLMADLGTSQHNFDCRACCLKQAYQFGALRHVPDVHAQADDLRCTV